MTKFEASAPRTPMQDFRYANPPLVEVVAEVHWAIKSLDSSPGLAIDPHFDAFHPAFATHIKEHGYAVHEQLRPDAAPMEFFGHQVTSRYRAKDGSWPCVQIGPGVLTVNMVPPYDGWKSFRANVEVALDVLYRAYPIAERYLTIETIQLRYIDAFSSKHLYDGHFGRFIREHLQISLSVPPEITVHASDVDDVVALVDLRLPLKAPVGGVGVIKIGPGNVNQQSVVVAQISVAVAPPRKAPQESQGILRWMDESHNVVRGWFANIVSKELERSFGERISV